MAPIARDGDSGAIPTTPVDRAERAALIVLSRAPGLSLRSVRQLLDRYGTGVESLRAASLLSIEELRAVCPGPRSPTPASRRALRAPALEQAGDLIDEVRARGLRLIGYGESAYPKRLHDLGDPPPVLFSRGGRAVDSARAVAIVGTRAASSYGLRTAYALGRELGRWGWTVVSGMARGVDAAAHAGALDGGGPSIGVLGSGHDHEYPPDNRQLYGRMRTEGVLLSEFEPAAAPTRFTFPRRNRLIAALARAVIVVEAGARSGALNTAGHALELGREVLAVPGRIDDPASVGCLQLLRQGAGLVAGAQDVFDALGWLHDDEVPTRDEPTAPDQAADAVRDAESPGGPQGRLDARLLAVLADGPCSPDELAVRLDAPASEILSGLGRLELEGWVERRPDGAMTRTRPVARGRA